MIITLTTIIVTSIGILSGSFGYYIGRYKQNIENQKYEIFHEILITDNY